MLRGRLDGAGAVGRLEHAVARPPQVQADPAHVARLVVDYQHRRLGHAGCPLRTAGRLNANVLPRSRLASAQMRPPCAWTMPRQIARPNPEPPGWSSRRTNLSKTCSRLSSGT